MVLPPLFRFSLTWLSTGSDLWTRRMPGTVRRRLELWPTWSARLWPKKIWKKCLTRPYWPACRTTAPISTRGGNRNNEKSKGRHRTRWRVCPSHGGKGTAVWLKADLRWVSALIFTTLLSLSWSGFSWVWVLPGLASSLGFPLKEPDVEQDLDSTVAGNQSKTVGSKMFLLFVFIQRAVLVLSWMRFTTEPSLVLGEPALKIQQYCVIFLTWV